MLQLQTSLLMFPGMLLPLLDKCGIAADHAVQNHQYFGTQAQLRYTCLLLNLVIL